MRSQRLKRPLTHGFVFFCKRENRCDLVEYKEAVEAIEAMKAMEVSTSKYTLPHQPLFCHDYVLLREKTA